MVSFALFFYKNFKHKKCNCARHLCSKQCLGVTHVLNAGLGPGWLVCFCKDGGFWEANLMFDIEFFGEE
jgi:hypothetical protein